jgi:hypothetical protein
VILRARVFGIAPEGEVRAAQRCQDGDRSEGREEASSVVSEELFRIDEWIAALVANLKRFVPDEFEKDNDENSRIDSPLRAINAEVRPVDTIVMKKTASKIFPAIVTTTAMICGLIAREMNGSTQSSPLEVPRNCAEDGREIRVCKHYHIRIIGAILCVTKGGNSCLANGLQAMLWTLRRLKTMSRWI